MSSLPRIPIDPPVIRPIDGQADLNRPLWSVMIPTYNCSCYLPEALNSVLIQAPEPAQMQIVVCDDASTDADVGQIVKSLAGNRIEFFRQPENVGSLRNFETCINRSSGQLIHLLHGDDKVRPGFYEKMEKLFLEYPDMGMAFCRFYSLDQYNSTAYMSELEMQDAGILSNWLERIASRQRIQTPSVVVRRSVYERLGSFYGVHYGEDWEMWIRIAAHYKVGYIPEALADYRKHDTSISGRYMLTGKNIEDLKKVMKASERYFPPEKWKPIHKEARKFFSDYAINTARKIWGRTQHATGTRSQIRQAASLYLSRNVILQAIKLYIKMVLKIKH